MASFCFPYFSYLYLEYLIIFIFVFWTFCIARNMDKSLIDISDYFSTEYENGLDRFLEFAAKDKPQATKIPCPCTHCQNLFYKDP